MALSRRAKTKLGWVAAAAGPIVAVQSARFLFGGGPVAASAAVPAAPVPPAQAIVPAAAPAPLTEAQARAKAWLENSTTMEAVARSPMHRPDAPRPVVRSEGPVREVREELPALRLGGIILRHSGAVASINNRLFSVGDEPVRGWTVERIEHEARRVVFRCDDGRAAELTSAGPRFIDDSDPGN